MPTLGRRLQHVFFSLTGYSLRNRFVEYSEEKQQYDRLAQETVESRNQEAGE